MLGAAWFPWLQPLHCLICKGELAVGRGHSINVNRDGEPSAHGYSVALVCPEHCPVCAS